LNRYQPIYDIAELCSRQGLTHAVLCPGSRCAPLALAFINHPNIQAQTFSDERSAAFIALGMAQQTKVPTLLLCTSGTAVYNFAPAVAEAYFGQTPLVIFTADRPAEWIAQQDGQTIHQQGIFGRHVKQAYQLPQDYDHPDSVWAIQRIVNEAIALANQEPRGPVHINAPFREPLYPAAGEAITFSDTVRVTEDTDPGFLLTEELKQEIRDGLQKYNNILLVGGQHPYDEALQGTLDKFCEIHGIPVAGDVISNLHPLGRTLRHADLFLGQATEAVRKTLRPDLLITFGQSVISKNLKLYLRKHTPKAHWHIQPAGPVADAFQTVTRVIRATPTAFFIFASGLRQKEDFELQKQRNFGRIWDAEEHRAIRTLESFFPQPEFAELELVHEVLRHLPSQASLHLANSMSVRYANFIGLQAAPGQVSVYANRGTSGIDGCTSTTVGHTLASKHPHVLITGDLAFFYDRNAFWHNYNLPNLRIVLLNNHGGIIFKMIDGPGTRPEADPWFVTRQKLNAAALCKEFGFAHLRLDNKRKVKNTLQDFFDFDGQTKILELESDLILNKTIFDSLKQKIKKSYES
jgi:2-succinyl-5-enolpyruvyl-6-hydroxy-3-cyclohexene-1-carboxylate synthase